MKNHILAAAVALLAAGCAGLPESETLRLISVPVASGAIVPDGIDSEEAWSSAVAVPLLVPADRPGSPECVQRGSARFLCDETYLYLYAELDDDDVVQHGVNHHQNLYETGDVVELFLSPDGTLRYWEILLAPNGCYSVFFFPSPGRKIFCSAARNNVSLQVAAHVDGTMNDWNDRDRGWSLEAAIPLAELTRFGDRFESGSWRILVGRYNYSATLPAIEYSAFPQLPVTNFHLRERYAELMIPAGER
ncbi:carbohydrate-binding family 9-like protein [uncultured Victivallis sp.]|uniref:carbohydrate-binding family 9-like protein n=1 Tax=uncultured Victivallis sp. TaxID=354118 RepID=UPI0025FC2964|nr:carbohydrate-binding family 9-like protein [uncultured Victivallis sp.]